MVTVSIAPLHAVRLQLEKEKWFYVRFVKKGPTNLPRLLLTQKAGKFFAGNPAKLPGEIRSFLKRNILIISQENTHTDNYYHVKIFRSSVAYAKLLINVCWPSTT